MGSIIIAMPNLENAGRINDILRSNGMGADVLCTLGSEVLQAAGDRDSGVVITVGKLRDMGYLELSEYLPSYFEVLVLSKENDVDTSSGRIIRLGNPFRPMDLVNSVDLILHKVYKRLKRERDTSKLRSADDKQLIDRAKQVLMERNSMTEPEAFRYVQKYSMDSGLKMMDAARIILELNCER